MKKAIIWIIVGVIIVGAAVAAWMFFRGNPNTAAPTTTNPPPAENTPVGITEAPFTTSIYEVALARAKQWQPNAALFKMTLTNSSNGAWDFVFVSSNIKGTGFEVIASGQTILSASSVPVPVVGNGTTLPTNLISPDQAMVSARAVPGYRDAIVTSVELIYNAAAKQWYWGVGTSKGVTLTISATP